MSLSSRAMERFRRGITNPEYYRQGYNLAKLQGKTKADEYWAEYGDIIRQSKGWNEKMEPEYVSSRRGVLPELETTLLPLPEPISYALEPTIQAEPTTEAKEKDELALYNETPSRVEGAKEPLEAEKEILKTSIPVLAGIDSKLIIPLVIIGVVAYILWRS